MSTTRSRGFRAGLVLAALLALGDVLSLGSLGQDYAPGTAGPPAGVIVVGALLGVATIVAVVVAWRSGSRPAVRLAAGTRILSMLLALPAFFVEGVPSGIRAVTALVVVLTVVALLLMFRRPAVAVDGAASTTSSGATR